MGVCVALSACVTSDEDTPRTYITVIGLSGPGCRVLIGGGDMGVRLNFLS